MEKEMGYSPRQQAFVRFSAPFAFVRATHNGLTTLKGTTHRNGPRPQRATLLSISRVQSRPFLNASLTTIVLLCVLLKLVLDEATYSKLKQRQQQQNGSTPYDLCVQTLRQKNHQREPTPLCHMGHKCVGWFCLEDECVSPLFDGKGTRTRSVIKLYSCL